MELRELYARTSPDGAEHSDVVADNLFALYKVEPNMSLGQLAEVMTPTLVLMGDDDLCTVDHADKMRRALLGFLTDRHGLLTISTTGRDGRLNATR